MKGLKNTLLVLAVYMAVIGGLFLFAPRAAESAFQISLPDPALTPLYGQVVLGIALLAYLASTDVSKYAKMVWGFIFIEVGHILIFGSQLIGGISTFAQVGPPMIAAIVFSALLIYFSRAVK